MYRRTVAAVVAGATLGISGVAYGGPSALTPTETFKIHGAMTASPDVAGTCPNPLPPGPPPIVPITIVVTGSGVISRLGDVTVNVQETGLGVCIGTTVPAPIALFTATATYTAQNGDQLVTENVSTTAILPVPGTPYVGFTSYDQPTGGTGRMAGASGLLRADVRFDPTKTPIPAHFTLSGTLTLPKK
jgi:hypothetical protein